MAGRDTARRVRRQRPVAGLAVQRRRLAGDVLRLLAVLAAIALLARWAWS